MEETVIVKSYPTNYDWLINEYVIKKSNGSYIKSPNFLCERKKEWYLQLTLNSKVSHYGNKSTISFLPVNINEKIDCSGSFISILNYTGSQHYRFSNIAAGEEYIFPENIYNQLNKYLSRGHITIRFLINPLNETKSSSTYECLPISLAHLYNNSNLSDIQLIVGKEKFYAHKAILANRSPVFGTMFQIEMKEKKENIVKIQDLTAVSVERMLSFIYMNKVLIDDDTALDLLKAADKYEIIDLKNLCEKYLMSRLDVKNCVKIVLIADMFNMQELKIVAINFIASKSEQIFEMQEIHELAMSNMDLHLKITQACFKFLHMMTKR